MTQLLAPTSSATRPSFTLIFRPEPGVDSVLALRALLKITLRRFGMRCVSAREHIEESDEAKITHPTDA
jgi:hypothetical protein